MIAIQGLQYAQWRGSANARVALLTLDWYSQRGHDHTSARQDAVGRPQAEQASPGMRSVTQ